jgi:hypothetical protein
MFQRRRGGLGSFHESLRKGAHSACPQGGRIGADPRENSAVGELTSVLAVLDPADETRHVVVKAMVLARHFRARLELFLCDSESTPDAGSARRFLDCRRGEMGLHFSPAHLLVILQAALGCVERIPKCHVGIPVLRIGRV